MKGTPLTDAQKAAMAAGRTRAAEKRRAAAVSAPPARPVIEEPPLVAPPMVYEGEGHVAPAAFAEPEPEQVGKPAELSQFDLFVRGLDDETRSLLNDAELQAIFEAQQKKALEEKKALVRQSVAQRAAHAAKVNAGLLPTSVIEHEDWWRKMQRRITWTVDMPEQTDWGLRVDGRMYHHGEQVTSTMAEYLSCREMMWRNRQVDLDFEGKSRLSHQRRLSTGALTTQI